MMPINRFATLVALALAGQAYAGPAPQPQFQSLRAPEKVVAAKPGSAPRQPAPITTRVVGTLDANGSVQMQCTEEHDAARAASRQQRDPLARER